MATDVQGGGTAREKRPRIGGYEIIAKLGQGGMGAVFKATQLSVGRPVALKVLPPRLAQNNEYVQRFFREARSAAKLNHPNIVHAIDAGEADGYHYFAMEFVEGKSVGDLLAPGVPLSEKQALEIIRDIGRALNYAHEAGIIHRDIKPANILLTAAGTAKLADLGLARETTSTESGLTQAGYAIGTPDYISPEQVRGDVGVDGRSDVYSLGATLYHMLVGRPPYAGGSGNEVMAKHMAEPIPDARKAKPQVSRAAARIAWKAMAKDRDRRYKTAGDLVYDIEQALAVGVPERTGPLAAARAARPKPGKSRGLVYAGAGVVAGLCLLMLAISLWPEPTPPIEPGPVGPRPKPTTTPAQVNTATKDNELLAYLRGFVRQNPGKYRDAIAKFDEVIAKQLITDPLILTQAKDDLSRLKTGHAQAADKEWAAIQKRADQLEQTMDYDAAIARCKELPEEFARLLAERANTAASRLQTTAETKMNTAIANAEACSKAGEPAKGLAELEAVKDMKFAALAWKIADLRQRLEKEQKDLASQQETRALDAAKKAAEKLLENIEAAAARNDLAGAARIADAALKDETLKPVQADVQLIAAIGQLLGKVAAEERAGVVAALQPLKGRRLVLATKNGPQSGLVKDITKDSIILDKNYKIGDEVHERPNEKVHIEDLTDAVLAQYKSQWKPKTPDERVALAIMALGARDAEKMARALDGTEAHNLHRRYADKLEELRLGARELAAKKEWETIKPYADKPKLTRSEAQTASRELGTFEEGYGATGFAASVADDIAALKRKIARTKGYFDSTVPLEVGTFDVQTGTPTPIGTTPAAADKLIQVPPDAVWFIAPPDAKTCDDRQVRAMATVIKENSIPGLSLTHCNKVTDAGLAELKGATHLLLLAIMDTRITDRALVIIGSFQQLQVLSLAGTSVTDTGLANLKGLTRLRLLYLSKTAVTDSGLASLEHLKKLTHLYLEGTKVTDEGVRRLKATLPGVAIHR